MGEKEERCLAEGKLAVAIHQPPNSISWIDWMKTFGVIGKDGTLFKFRMNFIASKALEEEDEDVTELDRIGMLTDESEESWVMPNPNYYYDYSVNHDTSCTFKIYNLNAFPVKITCTFVNLLYHDFGACAMRFVKKKLAPASHAFLAADRRHLEDLEPYVTEIFGANHLDKMRSNTGLLMHIKVHRMYLKTPLNGLKMGVLKLYNDKASSDFRFICQHQTFYVHKFVLSLWSESLTKMFSTVGTNEYKSNQVVITDFNPNTVEAFLRYMYTEVVNPLDVNTELLSIADKYLVSPLFKICENHLEQFGCSSDEEIIKLAIIGHQVNSKRLMNAALNKLIRCKPGNPALSKSWAKVCSRRPKLGMAMSLLLVKEEPETVPSSIGQSTSNVTLIY